MLRYLFVMLACTSPAVLSCPQFFRNCATSSSMKQNRWTAVILPKGYVPGKEIPVIIWLHGLGQEPADLPRESAQKAADKLNVAFVGVSGTIARGPHSFRWSEDPLRDARRITDTLTEVSKQVTPQKERLIALGFSEGAQMALEIAVRNPDDYAGAIALSPGCRSNLRLEVSSPSPLLNKRGFVLACGAGEADFVVRQAAFDARWLKRNGARVQHLPYNGVSAHAFPPDFWEKLPSWLQFISEANKDK
jgi:predicted esterase